MQEAETAVDNNSSVTERELIHYDVDVPLFQPKSFTKNLNMYQQFQPKSVKNSDMTSNNMGQTQFHTVNRAANQTSNASLLSMGLSCTRNLGNLGIKDELKQID